MGYIGNYAPTAKLNSLRLTVSAGPCQSSKDLANMKRGVEDAALQRAELALQKITDYSSRFDLDTQNESRLFEEIRSVEVTARLPPGVDDAPTLMRESAMDKKTSAKQRGLALVNHALTYAEDMKILNLE